jgi:hypothetical protein
VGGRGADNDSLRPRQYLDDVFDRQDRGGPPEQASTNDERGRLGAVAVQDVFDDADSPAIRFEPETLAPAKPLECPVTFRLMWRSP